jgi:hypothetical protein
MTTKFFNDKDLRMKMLKIVKWADENAHMDFAVSMRCIWLLWQYTVCTCGSQASLLL